jgi:hypothetical protein
MSHFLDTNALSTSYRSHRASRKPSLSEGSRGLHAYRSELMCSSSGGGDASENHTDVCSTRAARTPRKSASTASAKKSDSGGDSDGEGEPAPRYALSASSHAGFLAETPDGRRATLAVLDADGNVLSDDVSMEAFKVAVGAYREFLQGRGHLRVHSAPPIAQR